MGHQGADALRGRPWGRKIDFRLNRLAGRCAQRWFPNGRPRATLNKKRGRDSSLFTTVSKRRRVNDGDREASEMLSVESEQLFDPVGWHGRDKRRLAFPSVCVAIGK
jgi:hypothetical protein